MVFFFKPVSSGNLDSETYTAEPNKKETSNPNMKNEKNNKSEGAKSISY